MKRYSTLLIIREMQIKTTMRYHFIPTGIATIKKTKVNSVGEDVEKLEPLCTVGRNGKWCKPHRGFFKKLNIELPYNSAIPLLIIYPKELKAST